MKKSFFILTIILLGNYFIMAQSAYREKGMASYYADKFDGRKTASGEIFSNKKMTAAHRKLPFGTKVRVTNLTNNKSVVVIINDRGPYAHGRIIDLSKEAAARIGMLQSGLAKVLLEEIGKSDVLTENIDKTDTGIESIWGTGRKAEGFGVQIASFSDKEKARAYAKKAYSDGIELPLILGVKSEKGFVYRVIAGEFKLEADAEKYTKKLKKKGYEGFVKKY